MGSHLRYGVVGGRVARRLGLLAVAALLPVAVAGAQGVPVIKFKPANATLAEEFSRIITVRELADGRLLVADGKDNRLVVADFRENKAEQIGRTGSGPGEYRLLSGLFALGGDSTLLRDASNGRWLLLAGAHVVQTVPADAPAMKVARGALSGADHKGHVLSSELNRRGSSDPVAGLQDSMLVVRTDRASGRADTLTRLRPRGSQVQVTRDNSGNVKGVSIRTPPFATDEQATLFADGWTAVARLEPYRVEWYANDGRAIRGAPIADQPVRVDDREKLAYMKSIAEANGRGVRSPDEVEGWPATIPPFARNSLLAAPDGRLLLERFMTVAAPGRRYDVVDRRGVLVARVALAENERIAGFGPASVYVSVTDDDGIQHLTRHPWP